MITLKTVIIHKNRKEIKIRFGVAETGVELQQVYRLRYEIYVKKKEYIKTTNMSQERFEYDSYDESGRCVVFMAMIEGEVIGTVRTISAPLPIKKNYYSFEEPKEISCDESQKIELGRLISTGRYKDIMLPRHIIMLGLFDAVTINAKNLGIKAGYGAIKTKALNKIKKLSIPIKEINDYKLIYNTENEDPLNIFFNDLTDPVIPIYFIRTSVEQYFKKFFNNSFVFKKVNSNVYLYRGDYRFAICLFFKKIGL